MLKNIIFISIISIFLIFNISCSQKVSKIYRDSGDMKLYEAIFVEVYIPSGEISFTKSKDGKIHYSIESEIKGNSLEEIDKAIENDLFLNVVTNKVAIIKIDNKNKSISTVSNLNIEIPEQLEIRIINDNGGIICRNYSAENFHCNANNGDIDCFSIFSQKIDLVTSVGNIKCENCSGSYHIKSAAGNIILEPVATGKTENLVMSHNGDINVILEKDSSVRFNVRSTNGKVTSEIPEIRKKLYILNEGFASFIINSTNGDINLKCK